MRKLGYRTSNDMLRSYSWLTPSSHSRSSSPIFDACQKLTFPVTSLHWSTSILWRNREQIPFCFTALSLRTHTLAFCELVAPRATVSNGCAQKAALCLTFFASPG